MQNKEDEFLWVEKYRPQTLDDVIIPKSLKESLQGFIDSGELPNLMLVGTPGVGKTTVAKALCNDLKLDYMFINASEESGIEVLRNKIKSFASTVSFTSSYKVVILDEADYLNPSSTQPALRGFIEEFSKNCRFILTANFKNKIIDPLHSRLNVIDFKFNKKTDMPAMQAEFMKRAMEILENENIEYSKKVLIEIIVKNSPDWRSVLKSLQQNSSTGKLIVAAAQLDDANAINDLMGLLKAQDFTKMRKWVAQAINNDPTELIRSIYDAADKKCKKESVPQLVIILADYAYKNSFVADHELNIVAMLTEIMGSVQFK